MTCGESGVEILNIHKLVIFLVYVSSNCTQSHGRSARVSMRDDCVIEIL